MVQKLLASTTTTTSTTSANTSTSVKSAAAAADANGSSASPDHPTRSNQELALSYRFIEVKDEELDAEGIPTSPPVESYF